MISLSASLEDAKDLRQRVLQAGFAIVPAAVTAEVLTDLQQAAQDALRDERARQRGGSGFGLRHLFQHMRGASELASSPSLLGLAQTVLGPSARPVKAILFDKTPTANWGVPWHQDLTIAVRERKTVPEFENWSTKDGVPHVQAPPSILQQILAIRLHLDPCRANHGPLRVIPGSHLSGRLTADQIETLRQHTPEVICQVDPGDALLMCPLLLHASSPATHPSHRRVLHFEYSAIHLPNGLEWYA